MKNMIRYKTIYTGISDYIPEDIDSFNQINLSEVISIENEEEDLDIDEILKVSVVSEVTDKSIVKTAIGTSLEGQILTGYKLLTEGNFSVQINYCANDDYGKVYILNKKVYFKNATTLSEEMDSNTRVIASVYVEDIYAEKIGPKEILLNIGFIFTVENY